MGTIVRSGKSSVAAAIGGGNGFMLALTALSSCAARADDFCDTYSMVNGDGWGRQDAQKKEIKIREKCKVGDIITFTGPLLLARLCDLHQPVVSTADSWGTCFLAPPRKTY